MARRLPRALVLVVAAALAGPATTVAATTAPVVLGTTPTDAPIGALRGWVAWSTPVAGGYGLAVARDGTPRTLPIAPRRKPFDVDLGTDAEGQVVATFSRCRDYHDDADLLKPDRGCALRVVDLATGAERAVDEPRPRSSSDTFGSMWDGRVAFARRDVPRHKLTEQLELFDPATRRTRSLPHGDRTTQCRRTQDCGIPGAQGALDGIDLGPRTVAFRWTVEVDSPLEYSSEVRVDAVNGRRTALLATGRAGDCDDADLQGIDLSAPTVEGTSASFFTDVGGCSGERVTLLKASLADPRGRYETLHAGALRELAVDGDALYALVAPRVLDDEFPTCDVPGAPCAVERLDRPALTHSRKHRTPRPVAL